MHQSRRILLAVSAAMVMSACVNPGPGGPLNPTPQSANGQAVAPWEIKTRPFIDLWLHGFALLTVDSTRVPFFRRGYRDDVTVVKNQGHLFTQFDANHDRLAGQLQASPELVNAQFVELYFTTWPEMKHAVDLFERANGDPSRATSQDIANVIALLNAYFPTPQDREWLRLFVQSLDDEQTVFFQSYLHGESGVREPALVRIDSLWKSYRPKFQPYLNGTQQADGDFFLSITLDGEGRTLTQGKTRNAVVTSFPEKPEDALNPIYVFAHEVSGAVVNSAVNDNTTPNDKRTGTAARMQANGLVRGGELLLEKVAPELADGYARFYLHSANLNFTGDARAALAIAFPLPDTVRDGIKREIDSVLGGI